MAPELAIYVGGDPEGIDASRVLAGLNHLVGLINALDGSDSGQTTSWRFTRLALGSINTQIAPMELRPGSTDESINSTFHKLVDGLNLTEDQPAVPAGWPGHAIDEAARASEFLGGVNEAGTTIEVVGEEFSVTLTRKTFENLRKVTSLRRESIGSVIGMVETITVHRANTATMWTELGGHSVRVSFSADQLEAVRAAMGKRVEAFGLLSRDYWGNPKRLTLRRIEVLPQSGDVPSITEAAEAYRQHLRTADGAT